MATVSLSGGAWTSGFAASDLNALANGSQKTSTLTAPQIDNSLSGRSFVQVEVSLQALSPAAGANLIVVLVAETQTTGAYIAGSDGATVGDQVRWQNCPHAVIALRLTGTAAQVQRSLLIPVLPERYRLAVINRAGVALAASGNQVAWRLITEAVA